MADAGADQYTFHLEATSKKRIRVLTHSLTNYAFYFLLADPEGLIKIIRDAKMKVRTTASYLLVMSCVLHYRLA